MDSPIPVQIFQFNGDLVIPLTGIRVTGTINTITDRIIGITDIMVTGTLNTGIMDIGIMDIGIMDIGIMDITGIDAKYASLRGFYRDSKLTGGQNAVEFAGVSLRPMATILVSLEDPRFVGRWQFQQ